MHFGQVFGKNAPQNFITSFFDSGKKNDQEN